MMKFTNMSTFKFALLGFLYFLNSSALGSKCPQDAITKHVVCYYKGETDILNINVCNCTHVVFINGVKRTENNSIIPTEDTVRYVETIKERKENLSAIFTLQLKGGDTSAILKSKNKSEDLLNEVYHFLQETQFDGVELDFEFQSDDGLPKEAFAGFVKNLSKTLSSHHLRVKREGYDVFEKLDDITTASYTTQTPKNSTSKTQSIKQRRGKPRQSNRKIREDKGEESDEEENYLSLEEAINEEFTSETPENQNTLKDVEDGIDEKKFLVFVRLPIKTEIIAKKYDLKAVSRYADVLTVPTHDIQNSNEEHLTYHPSRLMGLADILNTDSILDFLVGMGGVKSKIVISMPATVLKFELEDASKNTPRSPSKTKPQLIDQSQLCKLFTKSNWTIERDEDLTAPYAFSGKTWLAFEDEISINIKGKYILLRELAGGAIYPIDADVSNGSCAKRRGSSGYLTGILHKNFESLERKPRALVLESLQEEIHDTAFTNVEAGVKLSEYRIVRVVDHSGDVHVIRKNTKTQFECSRQGYFSHPLGCNKFYRCVKFDQYSDEFTVFEYNCPAGLAFDERWEVCVWPGSLPNGAPCTGSSEIAPVPRSHYRCPNQEGYYADPENCRWFFACLDHARDGITPLTAYEFRCPFGLVFSQEKLACDWPWLVGSCGNAGAAGYLNIQSGGQIQGIHSATFINGGNLEASLGQYGNTQQEASFSGFGRKFGSSLKGAEYNTAGVYQGAQSAGFGYIAGQFDDNNERASFAAFPDYEISGGRIHNSGGVVLNQNIAGAGNTLGSIDKGAKGFEARGQYRYQDNVQQTLFEKQKPETLAVSGQGVVLQQSEATPKPFSVSLPSVQVNQEGNAGHSLFGSTTPQSIVFTATSPKTETVSIQHTGQSVSASIPLVTPVPEVRKFESISVGPSNLKILNTFGGASGLGAAEFGQAGFGQSSISAQVPGLTETHSFQYNSGASTSGGLGTTNYVALPKVTLKPAVQSFVHTSGGSTGATNYVALPKVTVQPGVQSIVHGSGGSVGATNFVASSDAALRPGVQSIVHGSGGSIGATNFVSSPEAAVKSNVQSFVHGSGGSAGATNFVSLPEATLKPAGQSFVHTSGGSTGATSYVASSEAALKPGVQSFVHTSGGNIGATNFVSLPQATLKPAGQSFVQTSGGSTGAINFATSPEAAFKSNVQSFAYGSGGSVGATNFVSLPAATVKPAVQSFVHTSGGNTGGTNYVSSPGAALKSNVQSFAYGSGGSTGATNFVSLPAATVKPAVQSFVHTSGGSTGTTNYVTVPKVTVQPAVQSFVHTSSGGALDISQPTLSTAAPFGSVTGQNQAVFHQNAGITGGAFVSTATESPKLQTHIFKNDGFVSGNNAGVSSVTLTPFIKTEKVKTGFGTVTAKPVLSSVGYSSIDDKVSNELYLNTPQSSYSVPVVTPKTEFYTLPGKSSTKYSGQFVSSGISVATPSPVSQAEIQHTVGQSVSTNIPLVTPVPEVHKFESVSVGPSKTLNTFSSSFGGAYKGALGSLNTYGSPVGSSQSNLKFSGEHSSSGSGFNPTGNAGVYTEFSKVSYGVPAVTSQSGFEQTGFVGKQIYSSVPVANSEVNVQTGGTAFGSVKPKVDLSAPQQSVFGYSTTVKHTENRFGSVQPFGGVSSTARPAIFEKTKVSVEPQPIVSIGTVSPVPSGEVHTFGTGSFSQQNSVSHFDIKQPSVTTPVTPSIHPVEFKSSQIQTSNPGFQQTVVNAPGVAYNQQFSQFKQKVNSFAPASSTEAPIAYQQELVSGINTKSGHVFSSSITPKVSFFEPTAQQPPVSNQNFEFVKTKPSTEERVQYIQHQGPSHLSVAEPEYKQRVTVQQPQITTSKPFGGEEKLVGLEITKSVELNPSQFFQSTGGHFQQKTEIEQQPLHLISQKTVPVKQFIQPFVKQEVAVGQGNNDAVDVKIQADIFGQKQRLPPSVTYNTVKTAAAPAQPVFEIPRASVAPQIANNYVTPTISIKNPIFVNPQPEVSSKVNLLLPVTTTAAPQSSQTEESIVQIQNNFDSRKFQANVRPSVSTVGSSGHLLQNFGNSQFDSGVKYTVNPNIEIPEPPKEYILQQNVFPSRKTQYSSTTESLAGLSKTTYLPPNAGLLNEGDDIHQVLDKYSGRFGQVIKGRNGKNGERQGSSTVRYEVTSTTPRSRGRQYHGSITSNLPATNKYEEYEIERDEENQRSFGSSKTTLDLKNLNIDKNKKTVIVVSQVSDANPILVGKLAGQCSCQSNMLEIRSKGKKSGGLRRKTISNKYQPPYESSEPTIAIESYGQKVESLDAPERLVIETGKPSGRGIAFSTEQNYISSSTTVQPEIVSSTVLSSLGPDGVITITPKAVLVEDRLRNKKKQFRGKTRFLTAGVPASEIANTLDYSALKGDESRTQNEIGGGPTKIAAGAAYDRYGPGGWRGFDETLQGSIDCKRPGLFRHPKYCNKFYACNYDPWEERYTLHVFNCPIQLTYDSSISACNWPVRGPACADDNLLV